jgi:tol-pal system protein YbgF
MRILVSFALVGCASPMAALREDNHHLAQTVAELRADRRAQDRKLRDLEHQVSLLEARGADTVPQLPVEVIAPASPPPSPTDGRIVGVADDGSEIVYEGDAALGKPATIDDEPLAHRASAPPAPPAALPPVPTVSDRLEVTHRMPPLSSARPSHARARADRDGGDAASAEYRTAVELLKAGKHVDAITALRAFIQHYPRHDYADNAQYWLGEAFYAQKDYPHALVEFRATIELYPRGNKVPDALLKVAYCHQALGQVEKAHAVLEQVVSLYPRTEPAALAAKRLESP